MSSRILHFNSKATGLVINLKKNTNIFLHQFSYDKYINFSFCSIFIFLCDLNSTICELGRYTNTSASTVCNKCVAGYYADKKNQTTCLKCEAGKNILQREKKIKIKSQNVI
jgi:hypothetical protein